MPDISTVIPDIDPNADVGIVVFPAAVEILDTGRTAALAFLRQFRREQGIAVTVHQAALPVLGVAHAVVQHQFPILHGVCP